MLLLAVHLLIVFVRFSYGKRMVSYFTIDAVKEA
jgi:hypothetical protein